MWKNVMWFTALGFLRPAIQIFLLPLYLAKILPSEYGVLTLVLVFSAFVASISGLKLDVAANTFYFDYNKNRKQLLDYLGQIFSVNIVIALLIFVSLFFLGESLFGLIFKSEAVQYYPYGVLAVSQVLIGSANAIYFSYLKNEMKVKEFVLLNGGAILLTVLLQAIFILQYDLGIFGILLGGLLPIFGIFLFIILKNSWLFNLHLKKEMIKPSLIFGLSYLPISFLVVFDKQIDRMVIERYLDIEQVGLYAILISIVGFFGILVTAYESAVRPILYQSLKDDNAETSATVNSIFGTYTSVGILAMAGILVIGNHFHWLTDNPKYLSIVQYFPYAIGATVPLIFVRYQVVIMLFYKKTFYLSLITFFKTIIMIIAMVILIPQYGIYGAIGGLFISYLLYFMSFKIVESKLSDQVIDITHVLLKSFLFLIFLGCHLFFSDQIGLSVSSILVLLLTAASLYFFEQELIWKLLRNVR